MRFEQFIRAAAPIAAMAFAGMTAACAGNYSFDGDGRGVPLAELDQSGPAPTRISVGGPDKVVLRQGDTLSIAVDGDRDAADKVRFWLEDGTLGVSRERGSSSTGPATVQVTMPPPERIAVSGSGSVESPGMARTAAIAIGGSGSVDVARFDAVDLKVSIGGSGLVRGAGTAQRMAVSIGGSGDVVAPELLADDATISIGGSGDVELASDGTVNASIGGSGDILVHGSAQCSVRAAGSGSLRCIPR